MNPGLLCVNRCVAAAWGACVDCSRAIVTTRHSAGVVTEPAIQAWEFGCARVFKASDVRGLLSPWRG